MPVIARLLLHECLVKHHQNDIIASLFFFLYKKMCNIHLSSPRSCNFVGFLLSSNYYVLISQSSSST